MNIVRLVAAIFGICISASFAQVMNDARILPTVRCTIGDAIPRCMDLRIGKILGEDLNVVAGFFKTGGTYLGENLNVDSSISNNTPDIIGGGLKIYL